MVLVVHPFPLQVDRYVHLNVLVVHNLPFLPLDAFEDGLADAVTVSPHPPAVAPQRLSPTFVVSMKVRSAPSSSAPSRTTASRKSVVNIGFTTGLDSMFFSTGRRPI